ncbi:MAG: hypothetical protein ACYSYV_12275 [Planctomycetota bacterium]
MVKKSPYADLQNLPRCAIDFIRLVIKKMRYRKKVRAEVMAELAAHFEDGLKDCRTDQEKEQKAKELVADFGDARLLGILLRRAKKRCRPLWRTMVARTFQAIGILFIFFIVYVAWFLTGKPLISVDYLAQLNQMVRPVADESLNAAPLYEKAVRLYGKCSDDFLILFAENYQAILDPDFPKRDKIIADEIAGLFANDANGDLSDKKHEIRERVTNRLYQLLRKDFRDTSAGEREVLDRWIEDQEEALDLVLAGTQKPYHWWDYGTGQNTYIIWSIRLPELSEFKTLTRVLSWRARLSAEQGRYKDALGDMMTCYRFGRHHRGNRTLIEQLVGMGIETLAVRNLRDILDNYEIDYQILTRLQKDLEQAIAGEDFTVHFEVEKLSMYDAIQRCFTQDRFGGGHICPGQFRQLMSDDDSYSLLEDIIEEGAWTTMLHVLFTHPNKQETFSAAEELYDYWESLNLKTPAQIPAEGIDVEKETMQITKGNILLDMLVPAFGRVIQLSYRMRAEAQALVTIIALLRYENDKGFYPENLNGLMTERYVSELPMDPWSDKPLVYKKTNDGFILYSIGLNFKDDGGQVIRDDQGRIRIWQDEGDAVFWPAPRPETPEEREKRLERAPQLNKGNKSRPRRRSK